MSDVTSADMDRLTEAFNDALSRSGISLNAYNKLLNQAQKDTKKTTDSFNTRVQQFNSKMWDARESVTHFTNGLDHAAQSIAKSIMSSLGPKTFVGLTLLGSLADTLWKAGSNLNETWREMTEIGQTFGGSMFKMKVAADAAGLPLQTFAGLQRRHNNTITQMGTSYWQVNKQLRQNLRSSGQYGMSMEQLGDFTANYLDISRQNGTLQSRSTKQVTDDMADLALTTTALASQSDKTREEIAGLAKAAMTSALAIGGIHSLPLDIRGQVDKSAKEIATGFAAIPGEAGKFLADTFGESLAGQTSLTSGGNTLIQAGLSGLVSQMQDLSNRVRSGGGNGASEAIEYNNKFMDAVEANMQQLTNQAMAGNQSAAQALTMYKDMHRMSQAEIEVRKKQAQMTEPVTAFFASFAEIMSSFKTAFSYGFITAFGKVFKNFDAFANNPVMETIKKFLGDFGSLLGKLLGTALTETNINALVQGIMSVTQGMFSLFDSVVNAKPLWDGLSGALTVMGAIVKTVSGLFGLLNGVTNKFGGNLSKLVGGALGALVVFEVAKKMFGGLTSIFGMFKKNVNINAGIVNVNGGSGASGALGAVEGAVEGKGKGSILSRARGAAAGLLIAGKTGGIRGVGSLITGMGANGLRGIGGVAGRVGLGLLKGVGVGLLGAGAEYGGSALQNHGYQKTGAALGVGGRMLADGAMGATIGSFIPGVGTGIGALVGAGYGAISGYNDYGARAVPAHVAATNKAVAATAAATTSIAATNAAMMNNQDLTGQAPPTAGPDPIQLLLEEVRAMRQDIRRGDGAMINKLDNATRLLSKIEVSAQSL